VHDHVAHHGERARNQIDLDDGGLSPNAQVTLLG
jgi:hypothetical protein